MSRARKPPSTHPICPRCCRNVMTLNGVVVHLHTRRELCPDTEANRKPEPRTKEELRQIALNPQRIISEGMAALARLKAAGLVKMP